MVISASLFGRGTAKLFATVGFFSPSWFDCLWTAQEVTVAHQAVLPLRGAVIPLQTATRALRRIERVPPASSFAALLTAAGTSTETHFSLLDSRDYTKTNQGWSVEKCCWWP